jgi:hypothetical protein
MTSKYKSSIKLSNRPIRAFLSYARADATMKDKFDAHISLLKREQLVDSWHDALISPNNR